MNEMSTQGESIADIGVGFSQAFPILVQFAVMAEGSRLIVEQPELHLYPWAQSELGRILCTEAKRGGKHIILETHSEHIIRGIQTHVSQARTAGNARYLTNEDVKILYIHKNGEPEDLGLNKYGELDKRWPQGFFDQGLTDLEKIIRNKKLPDFADYSDDEKSEE
jgi:predicted ATPase